MADNAVRITIPDELLAECRKAAEAVAPGKKFKLSFSMDTGGVITAHAAVRKSIFTLGVFGARKSDGTLTGAVTGGIEFQPAP